MLEHVNKALEPSRARDALTGILVNQSLPQALVTTEKCTYKGLMGAKSGARPST